MRHYQYLQNDFPLFLSPKSTTNGINLATSLSSYHVHGHIVWQHDSLVKEVRDMFHTHTAGGKGGENDEEERCQEGQRDGNEQQNKEPED